MKEVTKEEFYNYLDGKVYIIKMGSSIHSDEYIDSNTNEIIAYFESSSWGAKDIYIKLNNNIMDKTLNPELEDILNMTSEKYFSMLENKDMVSSIGIIYGTGKDNNKLFVRYSKDNILERCEFIGSFQNWKLDDVQQIINN